MLNKRGQVTLFVIAAIILVVGAAIVFSVRQGAIKIPVSQEEAQKIVSGQVQPISDVVARCAEGPVKEATKNIGLQGGYCSPVPVRAIPFGNLSLPYLVETSGVNHILSLNGSVHTVSAEILMCTNMTEIIQCIDHFNSFKKVVDVKEIGNMSMTMHFSQTSPLVTVTINYPLEISRGGAKTLIEQMKFNFKSGLQAAHAAAVVVTNNQSTTHDFDYVTYLRANANRGNVPKVSGQLVDPHRIDYYILTVPAEDEDPYMFNFAVEK
jgi:hypothetical protein